MQEICRGEVGFAATTRRRSWSSRPCLSSLASSRAGHAAAGNVIAPVSSAGFHYHSCLGPAVALKNALFDLLPADMADVVWTSFSAFPTKAKYPPPSDFGCNSLNHHPLLSVCFLRRCYVSGA